MKIKRKIFSAILLLSLMLSLFLPFTASAAATTAYTTVLEDLSKDTSFNINNYPAKTSDMSVKLIQIAEGEGGELFVYVYQPADSVKDLKATHINMSTHHYEDTTQNYKLYSLTWVNSYGTLDKYKVNDFKVSKDLYRYYNISTIYRAFDSSIDKNNAGSDDITGYKGYSVAKCIAAYNYNNTVKYDAKDISVVDVEIKSVGIVRYSEGYLLKQEYCDSHFVAFRVNNYDVKNIFDATITYTICDYSYSEGLGLDGTPNMSNVQTVTADITEYQKGSNTGGGIFGYKYEWPRIQTLSEFNAMLEDYTNEKIVFDEGSLGNAQFVFNFLETNYSVSTGFGTASFFSKRVTDVAILRLHFATDTEVYNLGAVSDIVSDDGEPDFNVSTEDNIKKLIDEYLGDFLMFLLLIILVVIILVFIIYLKPLGKIIYNGFTEIVDLILSVITLPFKFIASLFSSKRK